MRTKGRTNEANFIGGSKLCESTLKVTDYILLLKTRNLQVLNYFLVDILGSECSEFEDGCLLVVVSCNLEVYRSFIDVLCLRH
jgi:hypothetical protein